MWQNHSSLCSAPHCFTSDVSPSPYKPTDKILSHFLLSFVFYISFVGPQYPLKGGIWARSSSMFVVFYYFDMWYLFSLSQGVWRTLLSVSLKCLLFVLLHCCWIRMNMYVNIGLLKLEHRTQICKYGPLELGHITVIFQWVWILFWQLPSFWGFNKSECFLPNRKIF